MRSLLVCAVLLCAVGHAVGLGNANASSVFHVPQLSTSALESPLYDTVGELRLYLSFDQWESRFTLAARSFLANATAQTMDRVNVTARSGSVMLAFRVRPQVKTRQEAQHVAQVVQNAVDQGALMNSLASIGVPDAEVQVVRKAGLLVDVAGDGVLDLLIDEVRAVKSWALGEIHTIEANNQGARDVAAQMHTALVFQLHAAQAKLAAATADRVNEVEATIQNLNSQMAKAEQEREALVAESNRIGAVFANATTMREAQLKQLDKDIERTTDIAQRVGDVLSHSGVPDVAVHASQIILIARRCGVKVNEQALTSNDARRAIGEELVWLVAGLRKQRDAETKASDALRDAMAEYRDRLSDHVQLLDERQVHYQSLMTETKRQQNVLSFTETALQTLIATINTQIEKVGSLQSALAEGFSQRYGTASRTVDGVAKALTMVKLMQLSTISGG